MRRRSVWRERYSQMPYSTTAKRVRDAWACCLSTKCEDAGCSLILPNGTGDLACISGSKHQGHHDTSGKLCDCIIFWSTGQREVVALVELKGGHVNAKQCVAQIQNGANLVHTLLGTCQSAIHFVPLLVHRGMKPIEFRILKRRKISFRKLRYLVGTLKCGDQLIKVVAPHAFKKAVKKGNKL